LSCSAQTTAHFNFLLLVGFWDWGFANSICNPYTSTDWKSGSIFDWNVRRCKYWATSIIRNFGKIINYLSRGNFTHLTSAQVRWTKRKKERPSVRYHWFAI
jgi:hypothetical protein